MSLKYHFSLKTGKNITQEITESLELLQTLRSFDDFIGTINQLPKDNEFLSISQNNKPFMHICPDKVIHLEGGTILLKMHEVDEIYFVLRRILW